MKKYLIKWKSTDSLIFTTNESAENLKKALKQVSYFEKKTGYEIISIEEIEDEE